MVKILSVENFREGVRVTMISGKRVLDYLNMVNEQNHKVSVKLSAKATETARAVERLQEENYRLKGRILRLEQELCDTEAKSMGGRWKCTFISSGDGCRQCA